MREQPEENKSIKRFAYTGPSSKKHDETGFASPSFSFNRQHLNKSAFDQEDSWKDKQAASLRELALPSSPRTSTTGFYSRYSNYKGVKTDKGLPQKSNPSSTQQFSGVSGVTWNQSRTGYSYSHHDSKISTPNTASRMTKDTNTQSQNQFSMPRTQDTRDNAGRYASPSTSQKMRSHASSSWNDL